MTRSGAPHQPEVRYCRRTAHEPSRVESSTPQFRQVSLALGAGRPCCSHPDSRRIRPNSSNAQSSAPQFEHVSVSGGRALAVSPITL